MKPELEQLNIESTQKSFGFFKIKTEAFDPFWHYHPEIELTFIVRGEGTRFVGNSIEPFSNSDLVLVGKNIPHQWVSLKRNSKKKERAIVFQFDASLFSSFKECEVFNDFFELAKQGIQFRNISKPIEKLILGFDKLNSFQQLGSLIELLQLLIIHEDKELLTSEVYVHHHNQKHKIDKFAKVNNHILEHIDERLTVADMAQFTNMVPQSFCRWFKQNSGHSFITFLNRTRIENACQMLMHKDMQIQEVAFSSGFESLSHFNRTFKKYKHQSPREFVKGE